MGRQAQTALCWSAGLPFAAACSGAELEVACHLPPLLAVSDHPQEVKHVAGEAAGGVKHAAHDAAAGAKHAVAATGQAAHEAKEWTKEKAGVSERRGRGRGAACWAWGQPAGRGGSLLGVGAASSSTG